jgi:hypothetical protein
MPFVFACVELAEGAAFGFSRSCATRFLRRRMYYNGDDLTLVLWES